MKLIRANFTGKASKRRGFQRVLLLARVKGHSRDVLQHKAAAVPDRPGICVQSDHTTGRDGQHERLGVQDEGRADRTGDDRADAVRKRSRSRNGHSRRRRRSGWNDYVERFRGACTKQDARRSPNHGIIDGPEWCSTHVIRGTEQISEQKIGKGEGTAAYTVCETRSGSCSGEKG